MVKITTALHMCWYFNSFTWRILCDWRTYCL